MASTTCPQGHASGDPEWCDVCGAKIGAPATPPPASTPTPPPATPAGPATPCPHCGDLNAFDALFCEGCGYDFVTGEAPPAATAASTPPPPPAASGPAADPSAASAKKAGGEPAPPPKPSGWIALVEVSPEWFALKGELADAPCPPASSATIGLAGTTLLIGRSSQSRNIHPEIALDTDTAVSRRHAQLDLTAEGAWTVTDLGSTNGTHHIAAGTSPSEATTALAADNPTALADGDRIMLGAWTSITIRRSS